MTPNELDGLELAFHRESQRPDAFGFQVKILPTGFLVNVHRDGVTVCYLGGSIMPNTGTVSPWLVDAANRKTLLPVIEHERMRDLVRRMIMAIPASAPTHDADCTCEDCAGECRLCGEVTRNFVDRFGRMGFLCESCVARGGAGPVEASGGVCPKGHPFCGEVTTVGFAGDDRNRARCDCGWEGLVSELNGTLPSATVH